MPPRAPHPEDCRGELAQWASLRVERARQDRAHARQLGGLAARAQSAGLTVTEIARIAGVARSTLYTALGDPALLDDDALHALVDREVHAQRRERHAADDSPSPEEPGTPTEGEAR